MGTAIEWTDERWNPVTGCSKISDGCLHCYAEVMDRRFACTRDEAFRPWTVPNAEHNVRLHPDRLEQPLHWWKPRRVFVNLMSDLFHEKVPNEFIAAVFGIMASSPQHTFQILTKRSDRMLKWFEWLEYTAERVASVFPDDDLEWRRRQVLRAAAIRYIGTGAIAEILESAPWPLENVWIGVSVENQQSANKRIPLLFETPAAIRFLSCEPLLGTVDLYDFLCETLPVTDDYLDAPDGASVFGMTRHMDVWERERRIDWVIVGGESGPKARPMHPEWVQDLRKQCEAHEPAFFFKQWGEWTPIDEPWSQGSIAELNANEEWLNADGGQGFHANRVWRMRRVGKKKAGRVLDGRTWDEMPRFSL